MSSGPKVLAPQFEPLCYNQALGKNANFQGLQFCVDLFIRDTIG